MHTRMGAHTFTIHFVGIYKDIWQSETCVVFGAILILLLYPGIRTCLISI